MIRGTTAQFHFKLPYGKTDVQSAEVVFWQPNNPGLDADFPLPIRKGYKLNMSANGSVITSGPWNWIDDHTLAVKLWQSETLTFSDRYKAKVQLRAISTDGLVFASPQELVTVYPLHGDYPMGDDIIPTPDEEDFGILDGGDILEDGDA